MILGFDKLGIRETILNNHCDNNNNGRNDDYGLISIAGRNHESIISCIAGT